jgi:F-type H+-transporting ATPase subunit alpha
MVEILKQNQYVPMDVEKQIAIIFAASKGHLDDLNVEEVSDFEAGLFEYLDANASESLASIVSEGSISDDTAEKLEKAISDYKAGFGA